MEQHRSPLKLPVVEISSIVSCLSLYKMVIRHDDSKQKPGTLSMHLARNERKGKNPNLITSTYSNRLAASPLSSTTVNIHDKYPENEKSNHSVSDILETNEKNKVGEMKLEDTAGDKPMTIRDITISRTIVGRAVTGDADSSLKINDDNSSLQLHENFSSIDKATTSDDPEKNDSMMNKITGDESEVVSSYVVERDKYQEQVISSSFSGRDAADLILISTEPNLPSKVNEIGVCSRTLEKSNDQVVVSDVNEISYASNHEPLYKEESNSSSIIKVENERSERSTTFRPFHYRTPLFWNSFEYDAEYNDDETINLLSDDDEPNDEFNKLWNHGGKDDDDDVAQKDETFSNCFTATFVSNDIISIDNYEDYDTSSNQSTKSDLKRSTTSLFLVDDTKHDSSKVDDDDAVASIRKELLSVDTKVAMDQLVSVKHELNVVNRTMRRKDAQIQELESALHYKNELLGMFQLERDLYVADTSQLKQELRYCMDQIQQLNETVVDKGINSQRLPSSNNEFVVKDQTIHFENESDEVFDGEQLRIPWIAEKFSFFDCTSMSSSRESMDDFDSEVTYGVSELSEKSHPKRSSHVESEATTVQTTHVKTRLYGSKAMPKYLFTQTPLIGIRPRSISASSSSSNSSSNSRDADFGKDANASSRTSASIASNRDLGLHDDAKDFKIVEVIKNDKKIDQLAALRPGLIHNHSRSDRYSKNRKGFTGKLINRSISTATHWLPKSSVSSSASSSCLSWSTPRIHAKPLLRSAAESSSDFRQRKSLSKRIILSKVMTFRASSTRSTIRHDSTKRNKIKNKTLSYDDMMNASICSSINHEIYQTSQTSSSSPSCGSSCWKTTILCQFRKSGRNIQDNDIYQDRVKVPVGTSRQHLTTTAPSSPPILNNASESVKRARDMTGKNEMLQETSGADPTIDMRHYYEKRVKELDLNIIRLKEESIQQREQWSYDHDQAIKAMEKEIQERENEIRLLRSVI